MIRKKHIPLFVKILIIGGIFLVFLVVSLIKEVVNSRQIDQEIAGLENQISDLEKENFELSSLISQLQTGDYIEKEARLKLGLKKPTEKVVLIDRGEEAQNREDIIGQGDKIVGSIVKKQNSKLISNPVKWWQYFFRDENKK